MNFKQLSYFQDIVRTGVLQKQQKKILFRNRSCPNR